MLISRATDPVNVVLIGVPPRDLVEDVARGVYAAGLDVDEFFRRACSVTNEWEYKPENLGHVNRIQQRRFTEKEKSVPLTWRTLAECLDPQPRARVVIKGLLEYID